jgi:hypothetical protein
MGPAIDISKIARMPDARNALADGRLVFEVAGRNVNISVAPVATPLRTKMWLLVCPSCRRRCRLLYLAAQVGLCCKRCAGVRHPDQQTCGSERGRIQRCVQQVRRLEARLARKGPDRTTRRRLRRRRQRLLRHLADVLANRRSRMRGALAMVPDVGVEIQ